MLGIDVGRSEDRAFWTGFLRSLVKRGLRGVHLVVPGAHEGLKQAIATVVTGATWHGASLKSLPPHGAPAAQTSLREDLADDGVVAARKRHQQRVFEVVLVSGARAA